MVNKADNDAFQKATAATNLGNAPPGFRAALVHFFGVDQTPLFVAVDGVRDEQINTILGLAGRSLLVITSAIDGQSRASAAIETTAIDVVDVALSFGDPHPGNLATYSLPTTAEITAGGSTYSVSCYAVAEDEDGVEAQRERHTMNWIKSLLAAKTDAVVVMRYSIASTGTDWFESNATFAGEHTPRQFRDPGGTLHAVPVGNNAWTACGLSTEALQAFADRDWEAISGTYVKCDQCAAAIDDTD